MFFLGWNLPRFQSLVILIFLGAGDSQTQPSEVLQNLPHVGTLGGVCIQVPSEVELADLSPIRFRNKAATDGTGTYRNLNIGFQGLDLIQGQIYNPVNS